jgi:HEAT repeat protein
MEFYLNFKNKRDLFNDSEYFDDCSRLSKIVRKSNVTVLLAKLYAEQMIAMKEGFTEELPKNIPELMLSYLNELNRAIDQNVLDNREVHKNTKIVAWECLKNTFRPASARREEVLLTLGGDDAEKRRLFRILYAGLAGINEF